MAAYPIPSQVLLLAPVALILCWLVQRVLFKSALDHIRGPPKDSWWRGNFHKFNHKDSYDYHLDLFRKYGSVVKIHSLLGKETLYIADPKALHHILIKDQYTYDETDAFIVFNNLMFGTGLLSTLGDHHKKQRKMLNPVFSLKHMRNLLPIFYPIIDKLVDIISRKVSQGEDETDMMSWVSRAALEVIGQGGLGYSFHALDEGKTNTYSEAVIMMVPLQFNLMLYRQFLPWLVKLGSPAFRRKMLDFVPIKDVHHFRDLVDLTNSTSIKILNGKKEALLEGDEAVMNQIGRGQDILSILLTENAKASEEDRLPEEEVLGQMSTFISAGHETTTRAICRALHQLALHPNVQQRLREEVTKAYQEHPMLDYDALMSLPFLDAVCRETLRMFPPAPAVRRASRKDAMLPLLHPLKTANGNEVTEIFVPEGTEVTVGVLATNHSVAIWGPDADEWLPERWLNSLPESVTNARIPAVYSNIMTFIGGGRACIGFKYAELEMKLMVANLIKSFEFSMGKEIYWIWGNLMSPMVRNGDGQQPSLPLRVRRITSR